MYLHLGQSVVVPYREIVGVFDLDNTTYSKHTRKFLSQAEQNGQVVTVADDLPKSFLLTSEYGMPRIWLTEYNASTLEKRLK